VEKRKRYYSVQLIDGNTYNYGYIGSRATGNDPGDYLVVGPGWKGEMPAGIKKVFSSTTPLRAHSFSALSSLIPKTCRTWRKSSGGIQGAAALLIPQATPRPPARAQRSISSRLPPRESRKIFYEYLDAALQFVPPSSEDKEVRTRLASIGYRIGPRLFDFKDLSLEHKAAVLLAMKEGDDKSGQVSRLRK